MGIGTRRADHDFPIWPDPVFVGQDIFNTANRASIIAWVGKHGVPAIYPFDHFAAEGGLILYGPDTSNTLHRAVGCVSRILKGEIVRMRAGAHDERQLLRLLERHRNDCGNP